MTLCSALGALSQRLVIAPLRAVLTPASSGAFEKEEHSAALEASALYTRDSSLLPIGMLPQCVSRRVVRCRQDLQILKSIVEAVLVDVMNMLVTCQGASKVLLHDMAMLQLALVANPYPPIPAADGGRSSTPTAAYGGAESCGLAPVRVRMERGATLFTNHIWGILRVHSDRLLDRLIGVPCLGLFQQRRGFRVSQLYQISAWLWAFSWFEQTGAVSRESLMESSPTVREWVSAVQAEKRRRRGR